MCRTVAFPQLFDWASRICIALITVACASQAFAEKGKLRERLTPEVMKVVYPAGAERLGAEDGTPPAIAIYQGDKVVAYVFSTLDIIAAPGYTTTPFDVIAGVDLTGHITGAKVVFHNEPYIVHDTSRQRLLDTFLAREAGRPLRGGTNILSPDFVSGATISTRAMRAAVTITAGLVLRPRIARPAAAASAAPALDVDAFSRKSWEALVAARRRVASRQVTSGEVAAALKADGATGAKLDVPLGRDTSLYISFSTALFTPAAIGGNLVGMVNFEDYKRHMPADAQAIFLASKGPYNFLGKKFFVASEGNRFDRFRIVQDDKTFTFVQRDYRLLNPFAEGIKGQEDAGLFVLPVNGGFDPLKPWRLEILVNGESAAGPVTVAFPLDYKVPDLEALTSRDNSAERRAQAAAATDQPAVAGDADSDLQIALDAEAGAPAWVDAWKDAKVNVAILAVLLAVLTLIFIFQAQLSRSRLAHRLVRNGFLLVVLVWQGWIAGGQLSIRQCRQLHEGAVPSFRLRLLSRRAVDGDDRHLHGHLARAARPRRVLRLALPVRRPAGIACAGVARPRPAAMESAGGGAKRLWLGKYVSAALVLALRLTQSIRGRVAEVEPFETAITSHFTRAWPYVFYAVRAAYDRPLHRARLLPLSVSAWRRPRARRPVASRRSAEAASRMRQSVPSLREFLPGKGDLGYRQDQDGRMFPVPRLPGRILRRQALPAAGAGGEAPARSEAGRGGRRDGEGVTTPSGPSQSTTSPRARGEVGPRSGPGEGASPREV